MPRNPLADLLGDDETDDTSSGIFGSGPDPFGDDDDDPFAPLARPSATAAVLLKSSPAHPNSSQTPVQSAEGAGDAADDAGSGSGGQRSGDSATVTGTLVASGDDGSDHDDSATPGAATAGVDESEASDDAADQSFIDKSSIHVSIALLEKEWDDTFADEAYLLNLKARGLGGSLRESYFRSVSWKVFLGILPAERSEWNESCEIQRKQYEQLRKDLIIDPHARAAEGDAALNNPLSLDTESPWSQFFKDNELRKLIDQDVQRTFPESEFFQSSSVQTLMINILFIYTKQNQELSYRQGMHELLAPCVYLLHREMRDDWDTENDQMACVLDAAFLEHDAYALFSRIMNATKEWYALNDPARRPSVAKPAFARDGNASDDEDDSVVVKKLKKIQDKLLKESDPQLYAHLTKLKIVPQIYGLRWVRLLVGREFHLDDVLTLWTAIFADSPFLSLIDYVCVAMLSYVRDSLLHNDYTNCLRRLMKFPPVEDVWCIVERALSIRNPDDIHGNDPLAASDESTQARVRDANRRLHTSATAAGQQRFPSAPVTVVPAPSASSASPTTATQPHPHAHHQHAHHQQHDHKRTQLPPRHDHHPQQHPPSALSSFNPSSASAQITGFIAKRIPKLVNPRRRQPSSQEMSFAQAAINKVRDDDGDDTVVDYAQTYLPREELRNTADVANKEKSDLQEQVRVTEEMHSFCGTSLQSYALTLEDLAAAFVAGDETVVPPSREAVYIALAGVKHVKDLLLGTIPFDPVDAARQMARRHIDEEQLHDHLMQPSRASETVADETDVNSTPVTGEVDGFALVNAESAESGLAVPDESFEPVSLQ